MFYVFISVLQQQEDGNHQRSKEENNQLTERKQIVMKSEKS